MMIIICLLYHNAGMTYSDTEYILKYIYWTRFRKDLGVEANAIFCNNCRLLDDRRCLSRKIQLNSIKSGGTDRLRSTLVLRVHTLR
jgi:hypothetical protein